MNSGDKQAFPVPAHHESIPNTQVAGWTTMHTLAQGGMTLREYFVGQALTGAMQIALEHNKWMDLPSISKHACAMADILIAEMSDSEDPS